MVGDGKPVSVERTLRKNRMLLEERLVILADLIFSRSIDGGENANSPFSQGPSAGPYAKRWPRAFRSATAVFPARGFLDRLGTPNSAH